MTDKHTHSFKPITTRVPLNRYVYEEGAIVKDLISGDDYLKQQVCDCGKVITTDLTRKKKL